MALFIEYFQQWSLTILLCLFFVQCSNDSGFQHIRILNEIPRDILEIENLSIFPGDSEPIYTMDLVPEQTFGETGEADLTFVAGCVVDDKGRVIILDLPRRTGFPPAMSIHVYNPDGSYHTQIGGPGRGPGEFGMVAGIFAAAGNVYVHDVTNQRFNVYNTDDYSFERTTLEERWNIHNHEAVDGFELTAVLNRNDGNHLAFFREINSDSGRPLYKILLMDIDGNALDFQPLVYQGSLSYSTNSNTPSPFLGLSFMGETTTALSDEDVFYTAWTQDFLIRKYNPDGSYQSAIYYPVKGSPFDLDEHIETSSYSRRNVLNALENSGEELPESNRVLARLRVDDESRIWAAVPTEIPLENYEWWVLDESGELLAKLVRPWDKRILEIKDGYLYSDEVDEETGVAVVIKYRIELTRVSTSD